MAGVVADTHSVVWYVMTSARLSARGFRLVGPKSPEEKDVLSRDAIRSLATSARLEHGATLSLEATS